MKNTKRILSVKIKRMSDDSPDTSWMGRYSNSAETEYAIDRAHDLDCESVTPEFNGEDTEWKYFDGDAESILNRVRTYLENLQSDLEHLSTPNGCKTGWEACEAEEVVQTVWELEKSAGKCDCRRGEWNARQYRYFNGPVENYKGIPPAEIRKYIEQDYERMEGLNDGRWGFIGIRVDAEVVLGEGHRVLQTVSSGGLWGIESDADADYLKSIHAEELEQLKDELHSIGFGKRAIATAFKSVVESNG
jgi:hypothetical protein